jgi:hypothetical protein
MEAATVATGGASSRFPPHDGKTATANRKSAQATLRARTRLNP